MVQGKTLPVGNLGSGSDLGSIRPQMLLVPAASRTACTSHPY
jgi:hypothetical protein